MRLCEVGEIHDCRLVKMGFGSSYRLSEEQAGQTEAAAGTRAFMLQDLVAQPLHLMIEYS